MSRTIRKIKAVVDKLGDRYKPDFDYQLLEELVDGLSIKNTVVDNFGIGPDGLGIPNLIFYLNNGLDYLRIGTGFGQSAKLWNCFNMSKTQIYGNARYTIDIDPPIRDKADMNKVPQEVQIKVTACHLRPDGFSIGDDTVLFDQHVVLNGVFTASDYARACNKILCTDIRQFLAYYNSEKLEAKLGLGDVRYKRHRRPSLPGVEQKPVVAATKSEEKAVEEKKPEVVVSQEKATEKEKVEVASATEKKVSLDALSENEIKKMQAYEAMVAAGITLSDEQKEELDSLIDRTRKAAERAESLRVYRERAPEREAHQKEAMAARRAFNEQQHQKWEASIQEDEDRHNKELAELQQMRQQLEVMLQVKNLGINLSEEQNMQVNNNNRFVKFAKLAEEHKDEEGMNPEIRELMAEYYSEQETNGRSR